MGERETSVSAPLAGSIAYMAMLVGPATNRNLPCPSTAMGAALCAGKGLPGIAAREPEVEFLSNPEITATLGLFVPVPVAYTCCCGVWQMPRLAMLRRSISRAHFRKGNCKKRQDNAFIARHS